MKYTHSAQLPTTPSHSQISFEVSTMEDMKNNNIMQVFCIGTADTKLDEIRFLAQSNSRQSQPSCDDLDFVWKRDILSCCAEAGMLGNQQVPDDRGKAIQAFLCKSGLMRIEFLLELLGLEEVEWS
ncbi:hypothetical protein SASPL_143544 [Salvia splendens]|uniref:Uncharacterized protein n=1 Tax=Salvia splendens TaxID=180675 RepID=A0A8X8Z9U8_SALSN|nr:hypothetical protein SASPL_143544 [Salvia splendens]